MSVTDPAIACWLGGGIGALLVAAALARANGLPPLRTVTGLLLLGLAIFAGARVHSLLLEDGRSLARLVAEPEAWLGTGLRLPGGLLLATALGPLVAVGLALPYWRFSDIAITAGAALLAVGRISCHLAGCCFGVPSTLPWAISYGPGSTAYVTHLKRGLIAAGAPESAHIHPFAFYLSLAAAVVFFLLLWLGRMQVREGTRTFVGLVLLGIAFGAVEGLRDAVGNGPALYRQELWLAFGLVAGSAWAMRALIAMPAPAVARTRRIER